MTVFGRLIRVAQILRMLYFRNKCRIDILLRMHRPPFPPLLMRGGFFIDFFREKTCAAMETTCTNFKPRISFSLHEAAQLLVTGRVSVDDAEVMLARAIEYGDLPAKVKRWPPEQRESASLPGNINRLETTIERADLNAWLRREKVF